MQVLCRKNILVSIDGDEFYMSGVIFSSTTNVSEVLLISGETNRVIAGYQPAMITLESKALPCDKNFYADMILQHSGKLISSLIVDGVEYRNMIMTKGSCVFSDKSFVGNAVLNFKKR